MTKRLPVPEHIANAFRRALADRVGRAAPGEIGGVISVRVMRIARGILTARYTLRYVVFGDGRESRAVGFDQAFTAAEWSALPELADIIADRALVEMIRLRRREAGLGA
jgi:hypothetical protein